MRGSGEQAVIFRVSCNTICLLPCGHQVVEVGPDFSD